MIFTEKEIENLSFWEKRILNNDYEFTFEFNFLVDSFIQNFKNQQFGYECCRNFNKYKHHRKMKMLKENLFRNEGVNSFLHFSDEDVSKMEEATKKILSNFTSDVKDGFDDLKKIFDNFEIEEVKEIKESKKIARRKAMMKNLLNSELSSMFASQGVPNL